MLTLSVFAFVAFLLVDDGPKTILSSNITSIKFCIINGTGLGTYNSTLQVNSGSAAACLPGEAFNTKLLFIFKKKKYLLYSLNRMNEILIPNNWNYELMFIK